MTRCVSTKLPPRTADPYQPVQAAATSDYLPLVVAAAAAVEVLVYAHKNPAEVVAVSSDFDYLLNLLSVDQVEVLVLELAADSPFVKVELDDVPEVHSMLPGLRWSLRYLGLGGESIERMSLLDLG